MVADPTIPWFDPGQGGSYLHTNIVAQLDMRLDPFKSDFPNRGRFYLRQSPIGQYEFEFGYSGSQIYYQLSRRVSNDWDQLTYDTLPTGPRTEVGTWHNLIGVVVGTQIAYFVDGNLVFTGSDDDVKQGAFDMDAWPGTEVRIDNLRIWELDGL
jgi:hypothetical protein